MMTMLPVPVYHLFVGIDIAATSFTASWLRPGASPSGGRAGHGTIHAIAARDGLPSASGRQQRSACTLVPVVGDRSRLVG